MRRHKIKYKFRPYMYKANPKKKETVQCFEYNIITGIRIYFVYTVNKIFKPKSVEII